MPLKIRKKFQRLWGLFRRFGNLCGWEEWKTQKMHIYINSAIFQYYRFQYYRCNY